MPSTIDELKKQMANAAFNNVVEQNIDSMEVTILLSSAINNISSDKLVIILSIIVSKILINSCPDGVRQHYADLIKKIIDRAVTLSKE